ncbi:uncharacterized protein LOC122370113 [Amphibalanus amphitrite]|uniref:uncharacterized protein LOC122370113 n=1 Tax=Amphibalanus amphitrite TaxID=1232801 RepID=UPI001C90A6EE|nr:uncharacterized protein LOC122370113 [Amphibalanus amphitrite]
MNHTIFCPTTIETKCEAQPQTKTMEFVEEDGSPIDVQEVIEFAGADQGSAASEMKREVKRGGKRPGRHVSHFLRNQHHRRSKYLKTTRTLIAKAKDLEISTGASVMLHINHPGYKDVGYTSVPATVDSPAQVEGTAHTPASPVDLPNPEHIRLAEEGEQRKEPLDSKTTAKRKELIWHDVTEQLDITRDRAKQQRKGTKDNYRSVRAKPRSLPSGPAAVAWRRFKSSRSCTSVPWARARMPRLPARVSGGRTLS